MSDLDKAFAEISKSLREIGSTLRDLGKRLRVVETFVIHPDPGSGGMGDMLKAVYDADSDGVVDNSEALQSHNASYFATSGHTHPGLGHVHVYNVDLSAQLPGTSFNAPEEFLSGSARPMINGVRQTAFTENLAHTGFTFGFELEAGNILTLDYDKAS